MVHFDGRIYFVRNAPPILIDLELSFHCVIHVNQCVSVHIHAGTCWSDLQLASDITVQNRQNGNGDTKCHAYADECNGGLVGPGPGWHAGCAGAGAGGQGGLGRAALHETPGLCRHNENERINCAKWLGAAPTECVVLGPARAGPPVACCLRPSQVPPELPLCPWPHQGSVCGQ